DVHDRRRDQLTNAVEVLSSLGGQGVERTRFARWLLPPLEPFVDRLDMRQCGDVARKLAILLVADLVTGADRDPVEAVEHIELRHRETAQPVDRCCITSDDRADPAAPTRAAGDGTELVAQLADALAQRARDL